MTVFLHVPPSRLLDQRGIITHPLQRPEFSGQSVEMGAGIINPAAFRSVIANPIPDAAIGIPTTVSDRPQKLTTGRLQFS